MNDDCSAQIVLTITELEEIARPYTEPSEIAKWFRDNGFRFKFQADGYPLVSRQHFEESMGGAAAKSTSPLDLSGKDYFSRKEAAHYCCVSESQFDRQVQANGLSAVPFMGKLIYRRTDLQRAIEKEWSRLESLVNRTTWTGSTVRERDSESVLARLLSLSQQRRLRRLSKAKAKLSSP